jgi:hypothetical protein
MNGRLLDAVPLLEWSRPDLAPKKCPTEPAAFSPFFISPTKACPKCISNKA